MVDQHHQQHINLIAIASRVLPAGAGGKGACALRYFVHAGSCSFNTFLSQSHLGLLTGTTAYENPSPQVTETWPELALKLAPNWPAPSREIATRNAAPRQSQNTSTYNQILSKYPHDSLTPKNPDFDSESSNFTGIRSNCGDAPECHRCTLILMSSSHCHVNYVNVSTIDCQRLNATMLLLSQHCFQYQCVSRGRFCLCLTQSFLLRRIVWQLGPSQRHSVALC